MDKELKNVDDMPKSNAVFSFPSVKEMLEQLDESDLYNENGYRYDVPNLSPLSDTYESMYIRMMWLKKYRPDLYEKFIS